MTIKRYAVIMNPYGGNGRASAVWEQVAPLFANSGVETVVYATENQGHGRVLAQTLDPLTHDAICIVGGDGTVHEVANGLLAREDQARFDLGFIPAGTGNTLHDHLGLRDAEQAAKTILRGMTRAIDVVRLTTQGEPVYCVNIVGWGAISDIASLAERFRPLGKLRYSAATLCQICRPRLRKAKLTLDGMMSQDEFLLVIACNTKKTGTGMMIAPRAEIDDGKIDVVVLRRASRWQMSQLFRAIFDGSHLSLPFVEYHQVRSFGIDSETCDTLNLDGELTGTTPFSAEVLPRVLNVFA
ncbi:diacylglycerol/lipid kinase family protein [Bythopirellula polymerisocia]|uniref:Diacylglycerol kinase n=1 Tax=Bythopirellula polymerisocia TaxID=2528003 RepID=A0A5C6CTQ3_9BACT|nr:diacylglycerol kinase family protein [Bythopirellula polymerisocia]TWU27862.1 Diacylglycerol kinase [Bythopirellula polymerisocia]